MLSRHALLYPFKPGKAGEAERVFREGERPRLAAGAQTNLRSTTVFRKGDVVVRVFEIDGDLDAAVEHMVRASELSDVGEKLKPLLDDSVDLTTSDGLQSFFRDQMMSIVTDRPPREAPPEDPAIRAKLSRFALIYPFKPGKAEEAEPVYREGGRPPLGAGGGGTRMRSTTVFRKDNLVVRAFDIYGDLEEAIEHMARLTEIADVGTKLKGMLEDRIDLTTSEGVRQFFRDQMMDIVTDRPPVEESAEAGQGVS